MLHGAGDMHSYTATVVWTRPADAPFKDNKYSRAHEWRFDGGTVVPASSSPLSVRVPLSNPAAVDPEEALVAALSSCHMLFFLSYAAAGGFVIDRYEDAAAGEMGKTAKGAMAIVKVALRPKITWVGAPPSAEQLDALHHRSHESCYIANSVIAEIVIESR
jgi:organic hydroperoxide reductase OsmC/OhrA